MDWSPLDPKGLIQLVRCIQGSATWKIDEWAYFKTRSWTDQLAMEFATIEFVQKNAPSVPVPIVLEHYVNKIAYRSYLLTSNIPGTDLNDAWKTFEDKQKYDVTNQIAEHIYILVELNSERLKSADKKWIFEPFLAISPTPPKKYHLLNKTNPKKDSL